MHIVVSRVILCGTVMDVGCKTPGNHMLKVCVEGKKVFHYLKQLSRLRRKTKRRGGREVRLEEKITGERWRMEWGGVEGTEKEFEMKGEHSQDRR